MPRDRIIPADFWNEPDLATLAMETRFFYVALWGIADDYQLLHDDPRRCKAIFPYEKDLTLEKVARMIEDLVAGGWLRRYRANGGSYLYVSYGKPWVALRRRKNSDLPAPPWGYNGDYRSFPKVSESFGNLPHDAESFGNLPHDVDSCGKFPLKGKESKGNTAAAAVIDLEIDPETAAAGKEGGTGEGKPAAEIFRNFPKLSEKSEEPAGERQEAIGNSSPGQGEAALLPPADTAVMSRLATNYQNFIGQLSPIMVDELRDFARRFKGPARWIDEAFQEAEANGVRKWSYIRAILEKWQANGGPGKRPARKETQKPSEELPLAKAIHVLAHMKHLGNAADLWEKVKEQLEPELNPQNAGYLASIKALGFTRGGSDELVLAGGRGPILFARDRLGKRIAGLAQGLAPNVKGVIYALDGS